LKRKIYNVFVCFVSDGQHGYDPRFAPSMYPFFIAKGPAFLSSGQRDLAPFSIVDVYEVMCCVLGITPNPNNGSLSRAEHILKKSAATQA
jgi:ectonucleotide pyrophosphatase/phosphodiesterase family protein 5